MSSRTLRHWWATRSIALRVTVSATSVLTVGLVAGVAVLSVLFFGSQIDAVDASVHSEVSTLSGLASTGQLPDPLPAPADEPVVAQVLGADGSVRAATPTAGRTPLLPLAELDARTPGVAFTTTTSALGVAPLRVEANVVELDGQRLTVVAAVPYSNVRETLTKSLLALIVAVPVTLLAAGTATWLAVTSSLRPVDTMSASAVSITDAVGSEAPQLPIPESSDELARLARALNEMLARVHRASAAQRAFVADAAHELRSPIASIQAQVEVALMVPTTKSGWVGVGTNVATDVRRLSILVDDLLLLARLDAAAPRRIERVDLVQVLGLPGDPQWVDVEPVALRRAYDNLVANAHRHARTSVRTSSDRIGGDVVVMIDDDGGGVAPGDRERVFERWVRLDEARARDDGGAGLGLTIARSIARGNGGDVTLVESPLGGARAVLRIPAAADDPGS